MPQANTKPEHNLIHFNRMVSRTLANKIRRNIRIDLWGLYGFLILTTVSTGIFPKQDYEDKLQRSSKLGYPVFTVDPSKICLHQEAHIEDLLIILYGYW